MALLDVNALVALAWDSHVHHVAIRAWFAANAGAGWATCPVTESGFVRVSSNPHVLTHTIDVGSARGVLELMRGAGRHRFLSDDVSIVDRDFPLIVGHRQITDAHLLTLARRHSVRLVTFDGAIATLGGGDVEVLGAL